MSFYLRVFLTLCLYGSSKVSMFLVLMNVQPCFSLSAVLLFGTGLKMSLES